MVWYDETNQVWKAISDYNYLVIKSIIFDVFWLIRDTLKSN